MTSHELRMRNAPSSSCCLRVFVIFRGVVNTDGHNRVTKLGSLPVRHPSEGECSLLMPLLNDVLPKDPEHRRDSRSRYFRTSPPHRDEECSSIKGDLSEVLQRLELSAIAYIERRRLPVEVRMGIRVWPVLLSGAPHNASAPIVFAQPRSKSLR